MSKNKFNEVDETIYDEVENAEQEKEQIVFGIVSGCPKLNIRRDPNKDSEILGVIDYGTTVQILEEYPGFYNIVAPSGIEGFCVTDFIKVG